MKISSITVSTSNYDAGASTGRLPDGKPVTIMSSEGQNQNEKQLFKNINKLFEEKIINKEQLHSIEISDTGQITAKYMDGFTIKTVTVSLNKESHSHDLIKIILQLSREILKPSSSSPDSPSVQENIPILLTMPEEPKTEVDPFSAANASGVNFKPASEAAEQANKDIQSTENNKIKKLLTRLNDIHEHIQAIVQGPRTDAEKNAKLSALKNEFSALSLEMKKDSEKIVQEKFNKLEENLFKMTQQYNHVIDAIETLEAKTTKNPEELALLSKLKETKATMYTKIHALNEKMGERSLTTHESTAYHSHVMGFASTVEKKLTLLQRSSELEAKRQGPEGLSKKEGRELNKITKELKGAPTQKTMQDLTNKINQRLEGKAPPIEVKKSLFGKNLLPCFSKIKKEYKETHSHLEWGEDYLNKALTTPANWTTIRKAFIKQSGSGKMYVSVSVNEPLNIDERGGVPAGLRKAEGYNKRATNLIKTTSYIKSEAGPYSEHISFRGGQFPTVEAAREALEQIINHGASLETLHINALLTPFELPFGSIQPTADKKLLAVHKENIRQAIEQLLTDPAQNQTTRDMLTKLIGNGDFSMSNFGVNEGAVGELKKKGISLKWLVPGWHTSIKTYSNEASKKLTQSLQRTLTTKTKLLDYNIEDLDRLGAIVQVGQEMEAVWATNAYAEAKVGYNQFKLPSLWKTMDALIGVTCYTDCMSGKDRTGKVESQAQASLDEIAMNTIEHKQNLNKKFEELGGILGGDRLSDWNHQRAYLTAACFTTGDLQAIFEEFVSPESGGHAPLGSIIKTKIDEKFNSAKTALGIENESSEFMPEKTIPESTRFKLGTSGISTSDPKRKNPKCIRAASGFPQIAASSLFSEYTINWNDVKNLRADMTKLGKVYQTKFGESLPEIKGQNPTSTGYQLMLKNHKQKHLEASNSRLSQFGSLDTTKMNTGKPGFKVEGGEPLARATCGFDRDYVLLRILGHVNDSDPSEVVFKEDFKEDFKDLVGLGEFDAETQAVFLSHLEHAGKDMNKYLELVKEIEEAKMQTFFPQAKVKA